jgi:hypothetical protein
MGFDTVSAQVQGMALASILDPGDSGTMFASLLTLTAFMSIPTWLAPPDGGADDDGFGRAVAMAGNLALVGVPGRSVWAWRGGDVQAFFRFGATWQPIGDVTPTGLVDWDEYGSDIAINRQTNVVAIAAPGADRVYLAQAFHGACVLTGFIDAPAGFAGTRFGTSVALHGDLLVVGAQLDDTVALDGGAAHVFRFDGQTWIHEAHLVPTHAGDFTWAGRSVAVFGDLVAFGANFEQVDEVPAAGSVYLFRHTGGQWSLVDRLVHPDPGPGDYLGYDIAMDETLLIAGAILANGPDDEEDIGEVVCWRVGQAAPQLHSTVSPPDGIGGEFGYSVALEGETMVVGAIFHHASGPVSGAAYRMAIDDTDHWQWIGTVFPPPPMDGSQMGFSVALSGADCLVGCPRYVSQPRAGKVLVSPVWPTCPGDTNASGTVDVDDLLTVVSHWGPCPTCAGDVTQDGVVDTDDVLMVLGAWGACQ